jgi:hypothetical protein
MSESRGSYRTRHKAAKAEDKRSRSDCAYVESNAKLEKQFVAALERCRLKLAEQREEIRRITAIRRGLK